MSKVDDELTRRLQRAERPVEGDGLFEGLERRRSHRERVRRVQVGMLALAVLAATTGGFLFLRDAFRADNRNVGDEQTPAVANGAIVFSRGLPDGSEHLFAVQPGVVGERLITSGSAVYTDPSVAPDGRAIAVVHSIPSFADLNAQGVIATFTMDGGEPGWITDPLPRVGDPSWSPQGDQIAFAASISNGRLPGIYVIDADGLGMRLVAELDGFTLSAPDWSPDGRRLVFVGLAAATSEAELVNPDLYTVGVDGSGLTALTETPAVSEWSPSWSPDGDMIAYHRNQGRISNSIELIDSTGRAAGTVFDDADAGEIGEIDWSPDGHFIAFTSSLALTDSDNEGDLDVWTVRVDGTQLTNLTTDGASGVSWQPLPVNSDPSPTPTPQPSVSPEPEPAGNDIGLEFRLCHLHPLGGIDFLGDGTDGKAWTGTKVLEDGTCPNDIDDAYGVAVDFTGDGVADSWSGETMDYCIDCMPWRAADLNGDGGEELIVVLQGGTEIEFGLYGVRTIEAGADPRILPFLVGEPGHEAAGFVAGQPFTFWAGGDEGRSESVYCDALPIFWLTSISSKVEAGPDTPSTVHETQVEIGTDGIAHVLDSRTTEGRYPEDVQAPYVTADAACGIDFNWWQ